MSSRRVSGSPFEPSMAAHAGARPNASSSRINSLRAQVRDLTEKNALLDKVNQQLDQQNQRLAHQNALLKTRVEGLNNRVSLLESENAALKAQSDDRIVKMKAQFEKALGDAQAKHKAEIDELIDENDSLRLDLAEQNTKSSQQLKPAKEKEWFEDMDELDRSEAWFGLAAFTSH
jgi:DNA anti-recombination protein RmuC